VGNGVKVDLGREKNAGETNVEELGRDKGGEITELPTVAVMQSTSL
jgi:hypothetical protein